MPARYPARYNGPMTERSPLRLGAAHGFRWGPLDPELEASLGAWLAGDLGDAEVLKPGRVWRVGELCVKRYPRPKALGRLRRAAALRAGFLHAELLPLRTPRTVVALEGGDRTGLLISEFIEGRFLHRLWEDDPAGRAAFPGFMAQMHALGVLHGDLNVRNMLWTGGEAGEWVLIDLDSIVRGPRLLTRQRLIEAQWARILGTLRDRPGARELFDSYATQAQLPGGGAALWESASRKGREFAAVWDAKRARREEAAPAKASEAPAPEPGDSPGHSHGPLS